MKTISLPHLQQASADFYGKYFWKNYQIQKDLFLDFVISGMGKSCLERAQTLLDIGTGSGKFSILLKNRFPHLQVTAVDLSLENVHTARVNAQNTDTELSTLPASTLDLPFQNASFDLVLCVYMLQHTSDPQKGFQESVRVLKPGGTAFYAIGRENGLGKIHVRTRRLFHWVPAKFRNLSVAPLFPFYYALTHLLKRRKASYREMGKDMVDWLYNPLQNFIDEDEIENWFRQNRLSFEHLGYTGLLKSMLICRGQKQAEVT